MCSLPSALESKVLAQRAESGDPVERASHSALFCSVLRLAMIMTHLGRHLEWDWMGPSRSGRRTDANCRATGKRAFPTAIIHRCTARLAKSVRHHATDIIAIYTVEVFYLNEHFIMSNS